MTATAKITSRGQVTIPRGVREFLNTRIIEFSISDNEVTIRPVTSAAGSLAKYSKKYAPLKEVREKVWKEVANAKAKNTPS